MGLSPSFAPRVRGQGDLGVWPRCLSSPWGLATKLQSQCGKLYSGQKKDRPVYPPNIKIMT